MPNGSLNIRLELIEKIKLNYSILVSINKETILKICNTETNIVSFLGSLSTVVG